MSLKDDVQALIDALLPDNAANEISAQDTRESFALVLDNLDNLGSNYYGAVLTGAAAIPSPAEGATVLPLEDGTYINFGGLIRDKELCVFVYESAAWVLKIIENNAYYVRANKSQNLFDKTTVTLGKYVRYNNGLLGTSAAESASDYIPVSASTTYTKENVDQLAFYDASKVYISGESAVSTMVSPVGAAFVRISVLQTSLDTQQFVEGSVLPQYNAYNTAVLISGEIEQDNLLAVNGDKINEKTRNIVPFESKAGSIDISYSPNVEIFSAGTLAHFTKVSNVSEFERGLYYENVDSDGADLPVFTIPTEDDFGDVDYSFTYKSDEPFYAILIFRDELGFLNNSNQTEVLCVASTTEKTVTLSRKWETGVIRCQLWLVSDTAYTPLVIGNYKFGSMQAKLYQENLYEGKTTNIIVAPSGGDFTSIRTALLSITDASEVNKYHILVKNGAYTEIDIQGSNYQGTDLDVVVVEGETREGVTIITDGTSTALSPVDYSNPTYANTAINTIPLDWKHTFWIVKSVTFKNITAIANDVKYVDHQDASGDYDSLFDNCHLIKNEPNTGLKGFVVGIGSRYGQYQRFRNCIIEARWYFDNGYTVAGIYWHNWNNQNGPTGAEITDCHFVNCNELEVADAGSDHNDVVTMSGCSTSSKLKGVAYTLLEGLYVPTPATPLDYPYNLVLNINNCDVGNYVLDPNRVNAADRALALNQYHFRIKNKSGVSIDKGSPVKINWSDREVTNQVVELATDNDFDFITWLDLADEAIGYGIPKQKEAVVIVTEGGYDRGEFLKIGVTGLFEKTVLKSDAVGVVLKDVSYGVGTTGELSAYLF